MYVKNLEISPAEVRAPLADLVIAVIMFLRGKLLCVPATGVWGEE